MSIDTLDRPQSRTELFLTDNVYQPRSSGACQSRRQQITMDEPEPLSVSFGREGVFVFEQKPDDWFLPVLRRICELGTLAPNWDSYGARTIDPQIAVAAVNVAIEVLSESTPLPSVVPTCFGGIQLEWHVGGIDLEIEFESPETIHLSFVDRKQEKDVENVDIATIREKLEILRRSIAGE